MRISLLILFALAPSILAQKPEPMDYYGLARSLAIKEGKDLLIAIDESKEQGLIEGPDQDRIYLRLHCFEGCKQGDLVIARNRKTWLEWETTISKHGTIKYQKPTVKQSLTVDDCPTGK